MGREVRAEMKKLSGREVARRQNCFFLQENEWSRSYRVINQLASLPCNFMTNGFLDPSAFPDFPMKHEISR